MNLKRDTFKRIIAAALALLVVTGYAPTLPLSDYLPDMSVTVQAEDVITIGSVEDWNNFAANVKAGNTYSGQTVMMTADVGTVTTMVDGIFSGTFDGNGHTLTVNISGGAVATFKTIKNGTIQNLTLSGSVSATAYHAAALTSNISGTCNIKNVDIHTNVTSSTYYVGGFIGHALTGNTVNIENSTFSGSLKKTGSPGAYYIGGFIGWSQNCTITLNNCAFTGSYSNAQSFNSVGFACAQKGTVTLENFYSNVSDKYNYTKNSSIRLYTPSGYTNSVALVENGDNRTFYSTFNDALAAWDEGTTLMLLADTTTSGGISINETKTLDLNGRKMTLGGEITVASGELTIQGTTGGELTRNNATLISVSEGAELNIASGIISGTGTKDRAAIHVYGTVNVDGGTVTSAASNAFSCSANGTLNLNGGTVSSTSSSNDMTISTPVYAKNGSNITINLTGTTITSNTGCGIYTRYADTVVNISGGSIQSGSYALSGTAQGTITLSGAPTLGGEGIYLLNGKTITVNGALSNTTPIGVKMQTPGVFTDSTNTDYNDVDNFTSMDTGYTVFKNADGQLYVGIPISSVEIADITAPVGGEALDTAASTSTSNITLGAVTWSPTTTPAAYVTEYTATVIATPNENYGFTDTAAATVNGETADVTKNADGTLSISYTFPKTALTPVTITATDKEVTYSDDGIDIPVDGMFIIPDGAGETSYTITAGTGVGAYDAQTGKLTVTKCGTFTVTVNTDANDTYAASEASAVLTITKAPQNAPEAPAKASATVNSITLNTVENCEYSMDCINWQDSPTFNELSVDTEYQFYQRIKGDDNHEPSPASEEAAIRTNAHAHDFTYSANGATITATCGNSDGAHTGGLTYDLTITAPEKTEYNDGKSASASLDGLDDFNTATGLTVSANDISYSGTLSDGTAYPASTTAPVNAGTYIASITIEDVTASVEYTISKASQNAPEAPIKESATTSSITLTAVDGCEYSKDGTNWQDSPTFTGLSVDTEYTFYQRLKGDDNHEPSPMSEEATIRTNAHAHDFTYTANGAVLTATCGNSDGAHTGDISYDLTITAPEKTAYNDGKTAAATLEGLDDFNTATGLTVSVDDISYSGTLSDGTAYPASTTAPVNAGDYTASITVEDVTASVEYTISKASQNAPDAPTKSDADINSITLTAVDGCEYSKDGTNWQDSPTFTGLSADTEYTFYQRIKGDNDHDPSPASEGTAIRTNAHAHDFTYSANGAVLTATCGNSDGAHTGDISYDLTITAPEKTAYNDGKTAAATLEGLTNFNTATGLTVSADDISYSGTLSDGTAYPASTTAPVNAGDYTASITVEGVTASVEYTISKASQNAPDAPTKSDADINSITLTAVENCEYSIDGTTWQDSPTFTGLSADTEYTFYQRLKGNGNYEPSPASEGTAISTNAHVHDFTYSANGATITATCGNSDGAHTGSLTYDLTITAPEKTAFNDDKAAAATLDGLDDFNTATGLTISASDISYSGTLSDGTAYPVSTTAPVNAGDYSATITIGDATAYVDYTISKIDPTVEAPTGLTADYGQTLENVTLPAGWTWQAPDTNVGSAGTNQFPANYTPNDTVNYNSLTGVDVSVNVNAVAPSYQAPQAITGLIYNTIPQALVTAGSTSDGTMLYSLNGTDYSDSVPTGTTAGSYTVYWKVQGDENHTDTEVFTISVGIASTDPTVGAPEAITGLVYNGREQALVTEGTTDGGTMMYSVDGGSYSSDAPTGTDAKDYYVVSYYIQGDDNYNTTDPQTLNVSIAKAPQEAPAPGYTDETVAGLNDGTITGLNDQMEYSTTGTDTDYVAVTGDLTGLEPSTYYIRYAGNDNYLPSPAAVVTINAGSQVTITFDTCGGTAIEPITGAFGSAVTAPTDPVMDLAKFDGWDKEIPETIPAENMTITAKWIPLKEVSAVEAKCEESGNKLYYTDDKGNIYADKHGLNPTTLEAVTIPAKRHTAGNPVQENVVSPTADRSGSYDEVIYCTVCGVELSRTKKTIPAQGQNTPAPSPTPTPSYGPSAPYVPSTPAVTDTSAPYTTTSDITNYTITGKMGDHYESELSWDAIPKATDYSLYVKIDGKYVFLQDIGDNTHVDVILSTNGKYYVSTGGKYTVYTYDSKQGEFKKTGTLAAEKIDTVKVKNNVINSFMLKYTVDGKKTFDNESMKVSVKIYYKPAPKITASKGSVTLKWAKVDGATKYGIYKYVNGKLKLVAETKKLSARISGTKAGQNYTYAVKAFVDGEWTTVTSNDLVTVTAK